MKLQTLMPYGTRHLFRLLVLACCCAISFASTSRAEPPPGQTIATDLTAASIGEHVRGADVDVQPVEIAADNPPGRPARRGLRIRTLRPLRNFWEAQIVASTTAPVHRGQPALLTFWARTLDAPGHPGGEGRIAAYFQRSAEPWDKSFVVKRGVPRRWTLFQVPFRVHESFAASEAQMCLGFGFEPQAIEVSDVRVEIFPPGVELDTLPSTPAEVAPVEVPPSDVPPVNVPATDVSAASAPATGVVSP